VNDTVDGRVGGKHLVELLLVGDIGLVELGSLAADELDAVYGNLGRVVEVVHDDHLVAMLQQSQGGERADVARAAVIQTPVSRANQNMALVAPPSTLSRSWGMAGCWPVVPKCAHAAQPPRREWVEVW
jgi:hypothetical protein